jgi:alkanesulfonate monooxygenase SsuD/methylene tetrahydromethanopterin reductase-like flavin-dependent oxidoreductase (luciferase family)
VLPVVAETRAEAQGIYDDLLRLVPLDDGSPLSQSPDFPANRSIRALSAAVGLPLGAPHLDDEVPLRVARRFAEGGQRLLESVAGRTGRSVGGESPITFRHLLATHAVPTSAIVGSGHDVADHLEGWFSAGAVDGFNIQTPFLQAQFTAFTSLVVPELQRRGLFRTEYEGATLREHLGLARPQNLHVAEALSDSRSA